MGLDMYLKASVTFSEYDAQFGDDVEFKNKMRNSIDAIKNLPLVPPAFKKDTFFTLKAVLVKWRKANQIHKWFVDNLQSGHDDCQSVNVSRDDIRNLLAICRDVLKHRNLAPSLLPTEDGFFFGSTEYDEHYFNDLEYTIEMLSPLLESEYDHCDFYYSSSW
jgi:hypothetical protein